ncbi:Heterokaryon incompatibility protein (HET) domain containing protein [Rhypophila decipiens]
MRLINTQTLALEEFSSPIPPYAILSHRWETKEVTFKDYPSQIDPSNTNPMKGFTKIRYCIEQAKKDGLGYCWVDTCCIDKSSSAELSEAINSMYAWYRDSRVCYIYMADVDAVYTGREDGARIQRLFAEFRASKWFTRDWTLRELLAPRVKVFYNSWWQEITDVETKYYDYNLVSVVNNISGIPIEALMSFSPTSKDFPVAMKMSWASKRTTTRIEDTAYCLMGIFDVNMPLLYGEGSKAYIRLQEEIIRNTNDHSIFCWSSISNNYTYRGLLARSPTEFYTSSRVQPSSLTTRFAALDVASLEWDKGANNDTT